MSSSVRPAEDYIHTRSSAVSNCVPGQAWPRKTRPSLGTRRLAPVELGGQHAAGHAHPHQLGHRPGPVNEHGDRLGEITVPSSAEHPGGGRRLGVPARDERARGSWGEAGYRRLIAPPMAGRVDLHLGPCDHPALPRGVSIEPGRSGPAAARPSERHGPRRRVCRLEGDWLAMVPPGIVPPEPPGLAPPGKHN